MSVPDILMECVETYEKKNADYGDAWRRNGEIMYKLVNEQPVTLESPEDWIAVGLFTRRLDKFSRSVHTELLDHEPNYESGFDADTDESVYAAMQASEKKNR